MFVVSKIDFTENMVDRYFSSSYTVLQQLYSLQRQGIFRNKIYYAHAASENTTA